jgi:hypothetical protein
VKQLAAQKQISISPSGIRVFGAIFCDDELDLIGLNLPYSLVLGNSVFKYGIDAHNFHTSNDFTIDNSAIFDNLTLSRARIDGAVFARRSFIRNLNVTDSDVRSSIIITDTLLYETAQFDRVKISGDLNFRGSTLSFLTAQHAKIDGILDLSDTEARCAYHIKKSQIGAAVAVQTGFGTVSQQGESADRVPNVFSWRRALKKNEVRRWLSNLEIKKLIGDGESCAYPDYDYRAQFFFFDDNVRTSLCLKSFEWLAPNGKVPRPVTILALNGTKVEGHVILDIWPTDEAGIGDGDTDLRKLEAIGLRASALIYAFSDADRPFFTVLDGLNFDRVHSAEISCEYKSSAPGEDYNSTSRPAARGSAPAREADVIGELRSEVHPPTVEEVKGWLKKNRSISTQPFVAFIKAFENVGADATDLKVEKARIDWDHDHPRPGIDYVRSVSTWILGWIADYGYRPARIVWTVIAILVLFWVVLRWIIGIVAFTPDKKDRDPTCRFPIPI